jgi:hypothetical protein
MMEGDFVRFALQVWERFVHSEYADPDSPLLLFVCQSTPTFTFFRFTIDCEL